MLFKIIIMQVSEYFKLLIVINSLLILSYFGVHFKQYLCIFMKIQPNYVDF